VPSTRPRTDESVDQHDRQRTNPASGRNCANGRYKRNRRVRRKVARPSAWTGERIGVVLCRDSATSAGDTIEKETLAWSGKPGPRSCPSRVALIDGDGAAGEVSQQIEDIECVGSGEYFPGQCEGDPSGQQSWCAAPVEQANAGAIAPRSTRHIASNAVIRRNTDLSPTTANLTMTDAPQGQPFRGLKSTAVCASTLR